MSTIASPRETSVNGRRIPQILTPSSSTKPSLEIPRSLEPSPSRQSSSALPPQRRNRAALREYYNIKKSAEQSSVADDNASEVSSVHDDEFSTSLSELDSPSFDDQSYVAHVLQTQSLAELLKTYSAVLMDIRALDAEKKALVYDNYSKLIAATETIGKMRGNMGDGDPMAKTLDLAIVDIYERAEKIRTDIRSRLNKSERQLLEMTADQKIQLARRRRAKVIVKSVLESPAKVKALVESGRIEDARLLWTEKWKLLDRWMERGVGGDDVRRCLEEGESALNGHSRVAR